MKAIIVSAGQGRRLLPHTKDRPKCLLPVRGEESMLEVQLDVLARCGVSDVLVMVGFGAELVEQRLAKAPIPGLDVRTSFNPFFATTDNLATVWLAREEMREDFVLINGDTLFGTDLLERVLARANDPITVTINRKSRYDDDDMKVSVTSDGALVAIGKTLDRSVVDGESIGVLVFKREGAEIMRNAIDRAIREPAALRAWYLSAINSIASEERVATTDVSDLWWGEVDCREDLHAVRRALEERQEKPLAPAGATLATSVA